MSVAIVQGVTDDGRVVALRLNNDGTLALQATSADGETLGTGATAANQVTQIDEITQVRDRLPTKVASEATLANNLGTIDSPIATSSTEYNADDGITTELPWNVISLLKGILAQSLRISVIQGWVNNILMSTDTIKNAFGTQNDPIISPSALESASLFSIIKSLFQSSYFSSNVASDISQQMLISAIPTIPFCSSSVDSSGTIISSSSQEVFFATSQRRYLFIQNQSETEDLWINFAQAATFGQPSIRIPPLADFTLEGSLCFGDTINIIGVIGTPFTAKQGLVSITRSEN